MVRFALTASAILFLGGLSHAAAQSVLRPRKVVIERTCARDIERYCPDLANTGQQRNQLICLRPYRLDLTLLCHRAVDAALR